jgi:predicted metal-dependent peptidase
VLDSDLSPALLLLEADPEVEAVVVLTDGLTGYPARAVPYKLLWVLPDEEGASVFKPSYGGVLALSPPG